MSKPIEKINPNEFTQNEEEIYQQNPAKWRREYIMKEIFEKEQEIMEAAQHQKQQEEKDKKEDKEKKESINQLLTATKAVSSVVSSPSSSSSTTTTDNSINLKTSEIKMCLVTYNCGEIVVPVDVFKTILKFDENEELNNMVDFYIIALEELDMNVKEFFKGKQISQKAAEVANNCSNAIKAVTGNHYFLVTVSQLGGLCMMIFMNKRLFGRVSDFRLGYKKVGNLDLANKGGLAFSFMIDSTSVCVVGSHLAAHQPHWERRNQDFQDIFTGVRLKPIKVINNLDLSVFPARSDRTMLIKENDIVFWMRDLNYRIDETDEIVRQRAKENTCYQLIPEKDQLHKQLIKGVPIVSEFHEEEITFNPTFKFKVNTNEYHSLRIPAYCDRILYRTSQNSPVKCWNYCSVPNAMQSDHKPVRGFFSFFSRDAREYSTEIFSQMMLRETELQKKYPTSISVNTTTFHVNLFPSKVSNAFLEITNTGKTGVKVHITCPSDGKKPMNVKQRLSQSKSSKGSSDIPELAIKSKSHDSSNGLHSSRKGKHRKSSKDDENDVELIEADDSIPKWISLSQNQLFISKDERTPKRIEMQFKCEKVMEYRSSSSDKFQEKLVLKMKNCNPIEITLNFTLHKRSTHMEDYLDADGYEKQFCASVEYWKKLFPWAKFD